MTTNIVNSLLKRESDRQQEIVRKKNEQKLNEVKNEKYDYIEQIFNEKYLEITKLVEESEALPKAQLTTQFDLTYRELNLLKKFISDSVIFLRNYDIRIFHTKIQNLETKIKANEEKLLPKKKFGFKKKPKANPLGTEINSNHSCDVPDGKTGPNSTPLEPNSTLGAQNHILGAPYSQNGPNLTPFETNLGVLDTPDSPIGPKSTHLEPSLNETAQNRDLDPLDAQNGALLAQFGANPGTLDTPYGPNGPNSIWREPNFNGEAQNRDLDHLGNQIGSNLTHLGANCGLLGTLEGNNGLGLDQLESCSNGESPKRVLGATIGKNGQDFGHFGSNLCTRGPVLDCKEPKLNGGAPIRKVGPLLSHFESEFFGFRNTSEEIFKLGSSELKNKDVSLHNLENCIIRLHGNPNTLHISSVKDCTILTGPVKTSVFVENCDNCHFNVSCQQLRLHMSNNCHFYLHVTSKAIIEDSKNIFTAPYNYAYDTLEEDFGHAHFDPKNNHWHQLDDFNWLAIGKQSPNWKILDKDKRILDWDDFLEEKYDFYVK